ncbi:uncharacterized protein PV06_01966 [Exophiala oligosperma]|uniref:Nicotinamide-nucleotide adenylyltransferase n=2 Tax=Chaetothyriales TaxID=34395 RepID=A0A0D2DUP8_9EURO|nr:uncharacterized protein PV06_01966 [Exophiala oligosperma]KAJ9646136.1 hypothetical protein H2204_000798 [Knufia peltigerae]KIW46285.1 hypothetical protein PV06_01966 [Exophiala oligosperma]
MSNLDIDMQSLQSLRSQFARALTDFASSSSSTFKVLRSVPSSSPPSSSPIRTLYVLDSSFNPPSKAHLALVKNALKTTEFLSTSSAQSGTSSSASKPALGTSFSESRVLFLLATVNADKTPEPADFPDRLVMMTLMAEELRSAFSTDPPVVDVGITKKPYFVDKAASIDDSGVYTTANQEDQEHFEQIHLTGFDTLIRIFTAKYYPDHKPPLSALAPFLTRHRVRATVRVDKDSPSKNLRDTTTTTSNGNSKNDLSSIDGQLAYLKGIANGDMEDDGLKREWASRVDLVVDETGETEGVSSTRIRNAARKGNWSDVDELVGNGVGHWIRENKLYT